MVVKLSVITEKLQRSTRLKLITFMSRTITKLLVPLTTFALALSPAIASAHDLNFDWNASSSRTLWVGPVAGWCASAGNTPNLVRAVQSMLVSGGYYGLNCWANDETQVDGVWGSKTLEAVKDFQQDHGLTRDGCVGTGTWSKFRYYQLSGNTHMWTNGDDAYWWDDTWHNDYPSGNEFETQFLWMWDDPYWTHFALFEGDLEHNYDDRLCGGHYPDCFN